MYRESWPLRGMEGERFRPSRNTPSTARIDSSRAMRAKFRPAVRRTILLLSLTLCFLASLPRCVFTSYFAVSCQRGGAAVEEGLGGPFAEVDGESHFQLPAG
jgi:hypothetical protein